MWFALLMSRRVITFCFFWANFGAGAALTFPALASSVKVFSKSFKSKGMAWSMSFHTVESSDAGDNLFQKKGLNFF